MRRGKETEMIPDKNQFALTPPMGWNSYDYYDTTVTEKEVRANAEYMAEHLLKYGWQYIVVDIEWYAHNAGSQRPQVQYIPFAEPEMDEYSRLQPDPERFPSSRGGQGFRPLADYIHSLGLKFGIHIMRGVPRYAAHIHSRIKGTDVTASDIADPSDICPWNPDMYGVRDIPEGQAYYDSLLEMYAQWGVDYIKCDDIAATKLYPGTPLFSRREIEMLHSAIVKCGRPIVLSLSPGPASIDDAWLYEQNANLWRVSDDFWDDWKAVLHMFEYCELWQRHVAPGNYPDCDMLPFGWLGGGFRDERQTHFTYAEEQTVMTLWCIFGSPLMLGAEMTRMDDRTLGLLTNRDLLSLLDPQRLRRQVRRNRESAVWMSTDRDSGKIAAALFNFGDAETRISVSENELLTAMPAQFRECWSGGTVRSANGTVSVVLPSHGGTALIES